MARAIPVSCLIAIAILGASIGTEPAMKIEVHSNQPDEQLNVRIDNFVVEGVLQEEVEMVTPFTLPVQSKEFKVTLSLIDGEATFTATLMRKNNEKWVPDGLKGIGRLIYFTHTNNSGSVSAQPVQ